MEVADAENLSSKGAMSWWTDVVVTLTEKCASAIYLPTSGGSGIENLR